MTKKRDWIFFAVAGAIILIFLIFTFFTTERVVPYEEAMEYVTLVDGESAVVVVLNRNMGTVYAYNDGYFETGEKDNIYVIFRQSLFDRWFGRYAKNFATVVIHNPGNHKSGYETPKIWYIEDLRDPNVKKTPLNDRITVPEM